MDLEIYNLAPIENSNFLLRLVNVVVVVDFLALSTITSLYNESKTVITIRSSLITHYIFDLISDKITR